MICDSVVPLFNTNSKTQLQFCDLKMGDVFITNTSWVLCEKSGPYNYLVLETGSHFTIIDTSVLVKKINGRFVPSSVTLYKEDV